jgi:thiamine-phosphate pyrophosphorylase
MICLVTDRRRVSAGADATDRVVELVTAAARAGVDLIQIRERDLDARDLVTLVRRCVQAVEGTGSKVLVNDRADVALAGGAHGVHLRADSISAPKVRSILPAGAIVGRSVHGPEEAVSIAREGGVDYLIFGTLFDTPSKSAQHRLASLDDLAAVCRGAGLASPLPVLAIGGMTVERAALARRAGASGIAGIGLFIPPAGRDRDEHVQTLVRSLRRTFDTCQAVS